jgi:hypothetical protein
MILAGVLARTSEPVPSFVCRDGLIHRVRVIRSAAVHVEDDVAKFGEVLEKVLCVRRGGVLEDHDGLVSHEGASRSVQNMQLRTLDIDLDQAGDVTVSDGLVERGDRNLKQAPSSRYARGSGEAAARRIIEVVNKLRSRYVVRALQCARPPLGMPCPGAQPPPESARMRGGGLGGLS